MTKRPPGRRATAGSRWGGASHDVIAVCLIAAWMPWLFNAIRVAVVNDVYIDFDTFRRSALAWLGGGPIYVPNGNLNPPHFLLFIWPFTFASARIGYLVWVSANLIGLLLSLRAALRNVEPAVRVQVAAAAALFSGTLAEFVAGNVGGVLGWGVTLAWLADRQGRRRAAVWLGTAAAVKPFLFFVAGTWIWRRSWLTIALLSATVGAWVLAGWLLVGPDAYWQWRDQIREIDWYQRHLNVSVWRFIYWVPARPRSLLWAVMAIIMAWRSMPIADVDRRWAALLVSSLCLSPLGWLYYGWIAVAPVATVWRKIDGSTARTALIALCVPPIWPDVVVLAAIYPVATLLLWHAIVSAEPAAAVGDVGRARYTEDGLPGSDALSGLT